MDPCIFINNTKIMFAIYFKNFDTFILFFKMKISCHRKIYIKFVLNIQQRAGVPDTTPEISDLKDPSKVLLKNSIML